RLAPLAHAVSDLLGPLRPAPRPPLFRRDCFDELAARLTDVLVCDGARQVAADEGARLHLGEFGAAKGRAPTYSTPALPAPLGERVYVDTGEAGDQDDLDDRRLEQNDGEAGEDCDLPLTGLRERAAAYPPRRDS